MQWWLTVFFLLGGAWVPGDRFDGWASRAYSSGEDCEARRYFAETQTARYPLGFPAVWVCNPGRPAGAPPAPAMEADWQGDGWTAQLGESPPRKPGLEIFTHANLPWIAENGVGLRYTGPLRRGLAAELRSLLLTPQQRFEHVVLELDSGGGELGDIRDIINTLREVRSRMELTTRVMEGGLCASGCVPVFLQGEKRKASGASIWVFHGARPANSTIPEPRATDEYLDLLRQSGMSEAFTEILRMDNRIYRPGEFILSGFELHSVHEAGIITELLPAWREARPVLPPAPVPR